MKNFTSLFRTPLVLFQTDFNSLSTSTPNAASRQNAFSGFNFKRFQRFFKNSPYIPLVAVIVIVVVIAGFGISKILANSSSQTLGAADDKRVSIDKPLTKQTLNRDFSFPLRDEKGKEVSKLLYTVQSIEERNEIVVKGQKATAIQGRRFLIINLKITNNYGKTIQINARDYLRLVVNGAEEKLAPDIHNDPVEVQAISTKFTRVGLAINDTDKDIILQVGEISGKKESIKLDLK
jgi:hypothetical protein